MNIMIVPKTVAAYNFEWAFRKKIDKVGAAGMVDAAGSSELESVGAIVARCDGAGEGNVAVQDGGERRISPSGSESRNSSNSFRCFLVLLAGGGAMSVGEGGNGAQLGGDVGPPAGASATGLVDWALQQQWWLDLAFDSIASRLRWQSRLAQVIVSTCAPAALLITTQTFKPPTRQ